MTLACSGQAPGDESGPEVGSEDAEVRVLKATLLNETQRDGATVSIVQYPDDNGAPGPVFIEEQRSRTTPSVVNRAEHAEQTLTALEVFLAIDADNQAPHPNLLDYHERQTAFFGRKDSSILRVELAPAPLVNKLTWQDCKAATFTSSYEFQSQTHFSLQTVPTAWHSVKDGSWFDVSENLFGKALVSGCANDVTNAPKHWRYRWKTDLSIFGFSHSDWIAVEAGTIRTAQWHPDRRARFGSQSKLNTIVPFPDGISLGWGLDETI